MKNQIDNQAMQQFLIRVDGLSLATITPADIDRLRDLLDKCCPWKQLNVHQRLQLEQTISDLRARQREILGTINFTQEDRLATKMLEDISSELIRLNDMLESNLAKGPVTSMFN